MKILKLAFFEIKKIIRNPTTIILMIALPIIIAYLGSAFYPQNLMGDYKIGIYNEDKSFLGTFGFMFLKQFFRWDNAFEIFNEKELIETVEKGEFDSILIIPKGFMSDLVDYKETKLNLIPNPDKLQDSMAIYTIVDVLFRELAGVPEIGAGSTTQFLLGGGISVDPNRKMPSIELLVPDVKSKDGLRAVDNKSLGFKDIFAPSIVVVMILLFSMIGVGNSIASTKESGLLDIYRSNGLKLYQFISFKFIAFFLLGVFSSFIIWYVYRFLGVQSYASDFELSLIMILIVFVFTSLGIFLSSITKTTKATSLLLTSVLGAMVLFGDIIIPIPNESLVKNISNFMPIKYSVEMWRKMSITGFSVSEMKFEVAVLLSFGISFIVLSLFFTYISEKK
jgi:ABC-2 type transport system permease protein